MVEDVNTEMGCKRLIQNCALEDGVSTIFQWALLPRPPPSTASNPPHRQRGSRRGGVPRGSAVPAPWRLLGCGKHYTNQRVPALSNELPGPVPRRQSMNCDTGMVSCCLDMLAPLIPHGAEK